jgi:hypothetical protein
LGLGQHLIQYIIGYFVGYAEARGARARMVIKMTETVEQRQRFDRDLLALEDAIWWTLRRCDNDSQKIQLARKLSYIAESINKQIPDR